MPDTSPAPLALPRRPKFVDFKARSFTREQLQELADTPSIVRLDFEDCAIGDAEVEVVCRHPRLQSLWLAGTQVTDAALPAIAGLRTLEWLILDRTQVTGTGLQAFREHTALRTLWLSDTRLGDEAAPLLAAIPGLSILVIKNTGVTREGLLALARHPTLQVSAGAQFSDELLTEFSLAQRRHATRAVTGAEPDAEEAQAAARALQAFFEAMTAWERAVAGKQPAPVTDWAPAQCQAVFDQHCTPKERKHGRPHILSFSTPPAYAHLQVLDAEWLSQRKVFFYTRELQGAQQQHRFLVVKQKGGWRVDHKEVLRDGWQRAYL